MNYLEIVLQGYFNENNREFLVKYFYRQYKKAEKELFFEADEFFNGCLKIIEGWEKHLQDKVFERKKELYLMLKAAKNGTMNYGDLQGKTIEQKKQETVEYCEQELRDVRPGGIGSLSFTIHLHSMTNGRIAYNMPYNEVIQIKSSINDAFKKILSQKKSEQEKQKQNTKRKDTKEAPKTFDELFYDVELIMPCVDILKELDPPFINDRNDWLGKLKGVVCVWIDELKKQDIVKGYSDRKIYASLIPDKIKGFSIDESMFGKHHSKAENNHRADIKAKVSAIKLSQNSQKGELGK